MAPIYDKDDGHILDDAETEMLFDAAVKKQLFKNEIDATADDAGSGDGDGIEEFIEAVTTVKRL